ncbi:endodeoxyribonuclease [Stutzerimonas stutzeri]|uniref:endodeoxyribonuclease n=1 Tax=Stutzerimonas stutzeri TaxID=316 RepID=UPI00035F37B5|nr:endodeoxyribonuclease [Stutzerimonas stutzeri]
MPKACAKCGGEIPSTRRTDALYCTQACRAAAEKARYNARNPAYVERQRKLVRELRHRTIYGHTEFINNPALNPRDRFGAARAAGYRSGLEVSTARQLEEAGVPFEYEKHKVYYVKPETSAFYRPDYILPNGIIVETKGRFVPEDRKKHLLIKEQHPDLDIRFVFSRSSTRINKTSKTTYAAWCEKSGFQYADKRIPQAWIDEPVCPRRLAAIAKATK